MSSSRVTILVLVILALLGSALPVLAAEEYSIKVYLKEDSARKLLKDLPLSEVKKLPAVEVEAAGKLQGGPLLRTVLEHLGIKEYAQVVVLGAWNEKITLTKAQLSGQVVLDLAKRGTCKLAAPSIPKDDWVRDVMEVEIVR